MVCRYKKAGISWCRIHCLCRHFSRSLRAVSIVTRTRMRMTFSFVFQSLSREARTESVQFHWFVRIYRTESAIFIRENRRENELRGTFARTQQPSVIPVGSSIFSWNKTKHKQPSSMINVVDDDPEEEAVELLSHLNHALFVLDSKKREAEIDHRILPRNPKRQFRHDEALHCINRDYLGTPGDLTTPAICRAFCWESGESWDFR